MTGDQGHVVLRPLRQGDTPAVIRVWHESKQVAYPYLPLEQGRSLAEDDDIFRRFILPRTTIWVALVDGEVAGFLAIRGSYVDRLYIHPDRQRRGIGTALMQKAKALSPAGVQLHTHQQNVQARAFYEKHGLRAVKFGISPPPESEPDVEYHWTPAR